VPVTAQLEAQQPSNVAASADAPDTTPHPGGNIKHGTVSQGIRMMLFALYFNGSIVA